MLTGRSGNEKRYLGGWVCSGVGRGGGGAVMGLPKAFTGSIITARDSANGVLTFTKILNSSYSEINSVRPNLPFAAKVFAMPIKLSPI